MVSLVAGFEYVNKIDARKERMRELHKRVAAVPKIHPALNRKNCSLCLLSFPLDALVSSVTIKCLKELSKSWGVTFQKLGLGVPESSLLMQHRVPVCAMCSQFFDPDSRTGLAATKKKKRMRIVPYFDDAYPDLYSKPKLVVTAEVKQMERSRRASVDFVQGKIEEYKMLGLRGADATEAGNSEGIRVGKDMEDSSNREINARGTSFVVHAVNNLEEQLEDESSCI